MPGLSNRNVFFFIGGVCSALTCISLYSSFSSQYLTTTKRKRVVFFGDSITQHGFNVQINGWVSQLANWWTRRIDVVNRGYSGYNSKWARLVVEKAVVNEKPDLVFVFFGANDAVDKEVVQHVPLHEYEDNMRYILTTIQKKAPTTQIVIITPPPIDEENLKNFNSAKGKPILVDRTNERTLSYANACKSLGAELHVPVVDAWAALGGASEERAEHLSDGLHLSAKGCDALFAAVQQSILANYPDWDPENMKFDILSWDQIDVARPVL